MTVILQPFIPFGLKTMLTVTDASARVALPSMVADESLTITNMGASDVFIEFGDLAVAATATGPGAGYAILARSKEAISLPPNTPTHVALIAAAGMTAVVQITQGRGA